MTDSKPAVANLLESLPAYTSSNGAAYLGDSRDLLEELPANSIDLVVTSPPFDLAHQKEYGSDWESDYIEWFTEFADKVRPALAPYGSFVIGLEALFTRGHRLDRRISSNC